MKRGGQFPVALGAVLLAVSSLAATAAATASESPAPLPVLGVDPLTTGVVVEHLQDALPHWVEKGVSGAVLLHIDANHALGAVPPERLAALKTLVARRDVEALSRAGRGGGEPSLSEDTFIRAAAGSGIVREVVWVVPCPFPPEAADGKLLPDYLARLGIHAPDSGTFQPADGCYRGRIGEIPVSVCPQEHLPALREPVLLSIGVDFFGHAAACHSVYQIVAIRRLFVALRAARYSVLDTVLSYSVQSGAVAPDRRWIGEALAQALQDPSLALRDDPPARWSVLQGLAALMVDEDKKEMEILGAVLAQLEKLPTDPALLLYAAETAAFHGGGERALAYAEQACRLDRGYCAGLREIGLRFLERADVETALLYLATAERLQPGMEYGELDIGIALMKVGRAAEALEVLERMRARRGDFPGGFLAGAVHLFREDRAAARLAFDAALAALERAVDARIVREEIAQAVGIAAAFYREEGLQKQAQRLEEDPRLRLPAPLQAPGAVP